MSMNNIRMYIECDPEKEDTVTFYSRYFGGDRIVIIPKSQFVLNETETTFVLTLKNNQLT